MEEIIEVGFCAPTTREDCRVLPRKKYNILEVFDCPVFAGKLAVWETSKGKNSRIFLDGRGKPK